MLNQTKMCSIDDCTNPLLAKGLCAAHYRRVKRHGDVQADQPVQTWARLVPAPRKRKYGRF